MRRLSLRARLLVGVVALSAVGLAAADVATYKALESFLIQRTDNSLDAAHVAVENALSHRGPNSPGEGGGPGGPHGPGPIEAASSAAPGDYLADLTLGGRIVD